jgi:hypothetical protein
MAYDSRESGTDEQPGGDVEPARVRDKNGVPRELSCPVCGTPLYVGEASIHVPWRAWGWYSIVAELAFRLRGQRQHANLLEYGEASRLAAQCVSCGGVWISRRPGPASRR